MHIFGNKTNGTDKEYKEHKEYIYTLTNSNIYIIKQRHEQIKQNKL